MKDTEIYRTAGDNINERIVMQYDTAWKTQTPAIHAKWLGVISL